MFDARFLAWCNGQARIFSDTEVFDARFWASKITSDTEVFDARFVAWCSATLQREPSFQWKRSFRLDESSISVFFNIFRNLVMQPRFSMIYMVFIGIPAPLPITFAEVVLSSWNDFSFEKIAFRVDESSIFIINHLRPASEGQNHFQCSGTKQLWWKFASRCSETPLFANVHIRLRAFCFTWYHLVPRLFSAFRLDESSISVFFIVLASL